MKYNYYVIVDLETLEYMRQGCPEKIINADKFDTYEEARKELNTYEKDFNGAIYKIEETTYRKIKLVQYKIPK